MLVLVSYDVVTLSIAGKRRLRRVAKICSNFGMRVQYSVFECLVDPGQWTVMKNQLIEAINKEEDSLRFYFLGANWQKRVEHIGTKEVADLEHDPLII